MINYKNQDLINFPIGAYVEIVDWEGEVYDLGTVVGITSEPDLDNELYFKVKRLDGGIFNFGSERLRRISNV